MEEIEGEAWGMKCKECKSTYWTVRYTNIPREGDEEHICKKCGDTMTIYRNKESCRERREERLKRSETRTIEWICDCGCGRQTMILTPGPTIVKDWFIAECVPCGKRHDVFGQRY